MRQNENRPPRVALRPTLNKVPSHLSLRAAKSKPTPLDKNKSSGNITRSAPQSAQSTGKRNTHPEPIKVPKTYSKDVKRPLTPPFPSSTPFSAVLKRELPTSDANGTDADDEESDDLEEKIRSALSSPTSHRKTQTPGSAKSVRFDPAIVSYGRVTSGQKTPFEQALNVSPPISPTPPPRTTFADALQTLSQLKKGDQRRLRKLLEALKEINGNKSDDETSVEPTLSRAVNRSNEELNESNLKKLNPQAPAFRDFSTMKRNIEQRKVDHNSVTSLFDGSNTHSRAFHLKNLPEKDPKEPTWVNVFNPPAPEDMPPGSPVIPAPIIEDFRTNLSGIHAPPPSPALQMPLGLPSLPIDLNQQVWLPFPMFPNPYGLQNLPQQAIWINPLGFETPTLFNPYAPPPLPATRRLPPKPKAAKGPIVDVAADFIPPEVGHGRVAQAIDQTWGKSLLNTFSAKYPQTGKAKGSTTAPGQMRQAAAIQQQLEFLIYQEKEKKALGERTGNVPPPSSKKETRIEKAPMTETFSSTEKDFSNKRAPSNGKYQTSSVENTQTNWRNAGWKDLPTEWESFNERRDVSILGTAWKDATNTIGTSIDVRSIPSIRVASTTSQNTSTTEETFLGFKDDSAAWKEISSNWNDTALDWEPSIPWTSKGTNTSTD
ncbi:hypothetical protein G7Y89_g6834 [Cudoniella acicularis]|uniref:Uncharacterized protein n=1 Tax=Cudoniella acicularis TaxID=354080 RepID=A0A8H4W230_9HELO|nr:hypothetical protein G7Y89_g6834 [Cudoniella acicularis]